MGVADAVAKAVAEAVAAGVTTNMRAVGVTASTTEATAFTGKERATPTAAVTVHSTNRP